jgi:hypothetical protein
MMTGVVMASTVAPSTARLIFRQPAQPTVAGSLEHLGDRVVLGPEDVEARLAHRCKRTSAHSSTGDGLDISGGQLSNVMIRGASALTSLAQDDLDAFLFGVDHHVERASAEVVTDPRSRS